MIEQQHGQHPASIPKTGNGSTNPPEKTQKWSAEYYNELIEVSADAVISMDEIGNIELFNKAAGAHTYSASPNGVMRI